MSTEKLSTTEDLLLDLISFVRRFLTTYFDSFKSPERVLEASFLKQLIGDTETTEIDKKESLINLKKHKQYIDPFLYFVMCMIVAFSFYKVKFSFTASNLTATPDERLSASINYFIETSIIQKLLFCAPIILSVFCVVSIISTFLRRNKKRRKEYLFFRPAIYISLGTLFLTFVLTYNIADLFFLHESFLNADLLSSISLAYIIFIFVSALNRNIKILIPTTIVKNKSDSGNSYTTTIFFLIIVILSSSLPLTKFLFQIILTNTGQLKYSDKISITGTGRLGYIIVDTLNNANKTFMKGTCFIQNHSAENIIVYSNFENDIAFKISDKLTLNAHMRLKAADTAKTEYTKIEKGDLVRFLITINFDRLLDSVNINEKTPNVLEGITNQIYSIPYNEAEQKRDTKLKIKFSGNRIFTN